MTRASRTLQSESVDAHVDTIELLVGGDDVTTDGVQPEHLQALVRYSKRLMARASPQGRGRLYDRHCRPIRPQWRALPGWFAERTDVGRPSHPAASGSSAPRRAARPCWSWPRSWAWYGSTGGPSYERLGDPLAITAGDCRVSLTLREWINSGLMTFFFFVVGLEARREFDLGELRERRRVAAAPARRLSAGCSTPSSSTSPSTLGGVDAGGWGVAMSTDTALALGLLALVGRDVAAAAAGLPAHGHSSSTTSSRWPSSGLSTPTIVEAGALWRRRWLFAAIVLALRALGVEGGLLYFLLGVAGWVALLESGVDPVVRRPGAWAC